MPFISTTYSYTGAPYFAAISALKVVNNNSDGFNLNFTESSSCALTVAFFLLTSRELTCLMCSAPKMLQL